MHPYDQFVSPRSQIRSWIDQICAQGIRRPGSDVDAWCETFVADRFNEIGLQEVHLEPVPLPRWTPHSWSLEVDGESFECFPLPHSAPAPEGVEARIGSGRGEIGLEWVTLNELPQSFVRDRLAIGSYDPEGEFDTLSHTLPFGRQMQAVMEPSIDAGAIGVICVFDAPWESCDYYVPYDGEVRPIPGVWVSKSSGEKIRAAMESGATARIVVDSTREEVTTHNIVGTLPGASDEWLVIGSHHDGPWVSAVEDASGVALVLAQAAYWSQVPADERPQNMLFVVTSGHMVHGAGTRAFIDAHPDLLDSIVLQMHLEHTASRCIGVDGKLVPTDDPEVGWWFTSRSSSLIATVLEALAAEDVRRSLIMPPDVFAEFPTTDGGFFHLYGVPLVQFLEAPMYLFDSQDTRDKIHDASLEPVTRAAIRILASTAGKSAVDMRAAFDT